VGHGTCQSHTAEHLFFWVIKWVADEKLSNLEGTLARVSSCYDIIAKHIATRYVFDGLPFPRTHYFHSGNVKTSATPYQAILVLELFDGPKVFSYSGLAGN
jgi:hypothetical protein